MTDITVIINGHREGELVFPSLQSGYQAIEYANVSGLNVECLFVLDRPDVVTKGCVEKASLSCKRS